jgi:membrane-associated protein
MDPNCLAASAADMSFFQLIWDIVTNLQQYVQWWVDQIGPWNLTLILLLVIFCETGLVVMPWLPGDSLLFVAGALCTPREGLRFNDSEAWWETLAQAIPNGQLNLAVLLVFLPLAAIVGDNLNYWIGRFIGPRVFKKEKSIFFNADVLRRTHNFYEKHGRKTVVLARFVPLVRTFAPFVAGVGKMDYLSFLLYGIIGAFVWVFVCCTAGFLFGNIPWVKDHFEVIVLAVIAISLMPAVIAWFGARREFKRLQKTAVANNAVANND